MLHNLSVSVISARVHRPEFEEIGCACDLPIRDRMEVTLGAVVVLV